jgi:hypothetical protein
MSPSTYEEPALPRSPFVTIVAGVFIAVSGLALAVAVAQYRIATMEAYRVTLDRAVHDSAFASVAPPAWRFLLAHYRTIALAGLATGAVTLVASVGLLRRRNWARVLFVGLLSLGLAAMVASVFLRDAMIPDLSAVMARDSTLEQARGDLAAASRAMRSVFAGLALGIAGLFGWLIARFVSPGVRAEFVPPETW